MAEIEEKAENGGRLGLTRQNFWPPKTGRWIRQCLLSVTNRIFSNMDRSHVSLLCLLDLSKCFDVIPHSLLLSKLRSMASIRPGFLPILPVTPNPSPSLPLRWQNGFPASSQRHGSLPRVSPRSSAIHHLCQRPQPSRAGRSCDPVRWRYPDPYIRCQTQPSQPHPTHGVYLDLFSIVVPCTRTKTQYIQNGNHSPRPPVRTPETFHLSACGSVARPSRSDAMLKAWVSCSTVTSPGTPTSVTWCESVSASWLVSATWVTSFRSARC